MQTSNLDQAELNKFSALAHHWWDPDGELRSLHEINPLRLDWIDRIASLDGKDVLDVGCGGGILSDAMARRGARVLGIDLADKSLKVAHLHALDTGTPGIEYRLVPVEELAADEPQSRDVVTCMEMLEHVPDPAAIVRACASLLRPGGWAFFSTISRNAMSFAQAIVAAEYILGLLPRGTHEYLRFIRPSELAAWCRQAGLELQRLEGLTYNPVTRRYRLTPDTRVNYMLAARKPALATGAAG